MMSQHFVTASSAMVTWQSGSNSLSRAIICQACSRAIFGETLMASENNGAKTSCHDVTPTSACMETSSEPKLSSPKSSKSDGSFESHKPIGSTTFDKPSSILWYSTVSVLPKSTGTTTAPTPCAKTRTSMCKATKSSKVTAVKQNMLSSMVRISAGRCSSKQQRNAENAASGVACTSKTRCCGDTPSGRQTGATPRNETSTSVN
mmetsp:Transcript_152700/g.487898  ORF Transcript_152700/g.487898 Transcript_152700/m.487898 type:complete len:204 (-) Transcript_152700:291-902(-)